MLRVTIYIVIIYLFISSKIFGQIVESPTTIQIGLPTTYRTIYAKTVVIDDYIYMIEFDQKKVLVSEKIKNKYFIRKFDKNLKDPKKAQLDLGFKYASDKILSFYYRKGKIILLTLNKNKRKKERYYKMHTIDPKNLELINSKTLLVTEHKREMIKSYMGYRVTFSRDSTHLLISETRDTKGWNREINFCIVDDEFNVIHKDTYGYHRKEISMLKTPIVDNLGNYYFITYAKKTKKDRFQLVVGNISNNSRKRVGFDMPNDHIMQGSRLTVLDDVLQLIGFYSNKKRELVSGIFLASYSPENQEIIFNSIAFTEDQLSYKEINSKVGGMKKYYFRDCIMNGKGTFTITGERVSAVKREAVPRRRDDSTPRKGETYAYDYGNILICELDPKTKKINYLEKIKRKDRLEIEYDAEGNKIGVARNYYLHEINNVSYLIYRDHIDNKPEEEDLKVKIIKNRKDDILRLVKLNTTSPSEYFSIELKYKFNPNLIFKLFDSEFFAVGIEKKAAMLHMYTIEE